ncbi:MAG: hypothetical protein ABIP77_10515 [Candidatus Limnocylindrales bacterium]
MLLLQAEGLADIKPYQGATVTWLTVDEYQEIHFLLDALESPALPLVIERIDRRDLARAGRLVARAMRARAAQDSSSLVNSRPLSTRVYSGTLVRNG